MLFELAGRLTVGDFTLELEQAWDTPAAAVFGPSGAGKSLLIELIAGFRSLERGTLRFAGELLDDGRRAVAPRQRRFGWVPQEPTLWPHMSVRRNVEYGLRDRAMCARAVELLEIGALLDRRPSELSGGQQRRVALARAVASAPRLLLLDEPLAGLDIPLRDRIAGYIRRLQAALDVPYLYVGHERHELFLLTDYVLVLQNGRCTATGRPSDVLGSARRAVVGRDPRAANQFAARVVRHDAGAGVAWLQLETGTAVCLPIGAAPEVGSEIAAAVDPADIIISTATPSGVSAQNRLAVRITTVYADGASRRIVTRDAHGAAFETRVTAAAAQQLGLAADQQVWLLFKAHAVHVV